VNAEELFARMSVILKEVKRLDEENPTGPDEETDPRIVELLAEAEQVQKQLDPLMRSRHRHNPAKLAEWDEIMHMCDDLEEGSPTDGETSRAN
jgi:hypothetical protein